MCFEATWLAGISRIVYGMSIKDSAQAFPEIQISARRLNVLGGERLLIESGVLADEILAIFKQRTDN